MYLADGGTAWLASVDSDDRSWHIKPRAVALYLCGTELSYIQAPKPWQWQEGGWEEGHEWVRSSCDDGAFGDDGAFAAAAPSAEPTPAPTTAAPTFGPTPRPTPRPTPVPNSVQRQRRSFTRFFF